MAGMMVDGKGEGGEVISEQLSVIGETAKVAGCKLSSVRPGKTVTTEDGQVAGLGRCADGLLD
jgi:hypothetical protein